MSVSTESRETDPRDHFVARNGNFTPPSDHNASSSDVDLDKAYRDLIWACRTGDTVLADSLSLLPELDLNKVDEWDYSPLILASLCGHIEIVRMLLARGATCERDTFQGARCIYGALNDEIRNLLLSYYISKKVDEDQPFSAHLSSLLAPAMGLQAFRDLAIVFPHETKGELRSFTVNRFLLSARSPHYQKLLAPGGEYSTKAVHIASEDEDASTFRTILDYIYLRTDSLSLDKPPPSLLAYVEKLGLIDLHHSILQIEDKNSVRSSSQASLKFADGARENMKTFLENHIFANALVKPLDEIDFQKCKIQHSYESDIESDDGDEEIDLQNIVPDLLLNDEDKVKLQLSSAIPDVILCSPDLETNSLVFYPVHRAMLIRSSYYQANFDPSWSSSALPLVEGHINDQVVDRPALTAKDIAIHPICASVTKKEVAEIILRFLYYNDSIVIRPEVALEVLEAADSLCIDRLKSICEVSLTNFVASLSFDVLKALPSTVGYDVFELIETAWQFRCDRLEQHMTKLIAHNIEAVCEDKALRAELCELIKASAWSIKKREATDTIELVDDMRYYLAKKFAVYDEFEGLEGVGASLNPALGELEDNRTLLAAKLDYEHDVAIIDRLLEELGLEA